MFKIGSINIATELSPKHPDFVKLLHLISSVENLSSSINEQPVYPEWREKIEKMEFARAVQGTVALEGSEIKIEDVEKVLEKEKGAVLISDTEKEAANALKAFEFIREWSSKNPEEKISESLIKQLHTIITRDINYYLNVPGQYRNQIVKFGYPEKEAPLKDMFAVQKVMTNLVDSINSINSINTEEGEVSLLGFSPIIKAILSHYFMTIIHPFIDGNGRVARAVEALILHHYGHYESYFFPITARFYYKERKKYFEMLRETDNTGDPIPLLIFALQGLLENLTEIKKGILDQITI